MVSAFHAHRKPMSGEEQQAEGLGRSCDFLLLFPELLVVHFFAGSRTHSPSRSKMGKKWRRTEERAVSLYK